MNETKTAAQESTDMCVSDVNAINQYYMISKDAKSIGWNGDKINKDDLIVIFNVKVMGDKFLFRALHTYNVQKMEFNAIPELVKIKED